MMLRNILIISALLNSVLIMAVVGVVPFLLYLSVVINCVMMWYIQKILNLSNDLNEDVIELYSEI